MSDKTDCICSGLKKRPRSPRRADPLTQALESFEQIEGRFYEGIRALKMARKQCVDLLANSNRHARAMRALATIAADGCQYAQTLQVECRERSADPTSTWCRPCYAKHVLEGGVP